MGDFDVAGMLKHLQIDEDGAMSLASAEGARELFFHDCDDETVRWAFERLCKERAGETSTVAVSLPRFWSANIPRSFIRCLQDRAQPEWLSELVADRLGVEPLTIDASHSPFLSRPAELAELLVRVRRPRPSVLCAPTNPRAPEKLSCATHMALP